MGFFNSDFNLVQQIIAFAAFLISVAFHEYSHGFMANLLGDDTAEREGRLTLNPVSHIDLFGSIILPLVLILTRSQFIFGWAKPVPYNPNNLRRPLRDGALVALAGPVANIIIAIFGAILIRLAIAQDIGSVTSLSLIAYIVFINIFLALFNLIPVPPLDGSKLLAAVLPEAGRDMFAAIERMGPMVFIVVLFVLVSFVAPFVFSLSSGIFNLLIGV